MRRLDPQRLLAAVNEQRAALGTPAWAGPLTAVAAMRLLDLLSTRAPGRAVEVRIPPVAAIQCVEGPRHTRGTPPNVVETDAVTWVRLATGRLAWPDALADGRIRASGPRADLSGYLPLPPAEVAG